MHRERKGFGLTFEYVGVSRHLDRHQLEFWMAALMIGCRQLTKRRLTALDPKQTSEDRGGPGLMQAANEGARAAQASQGVQSIGIRVHLPFEQDVNPFVEQTFEHPTSSPGCATSR
jgi:hypothetical protein